MAYTGVLRRWGNGLTREFHRGKRDVFDLSEPREHCPRAEVIIHEECRRKASKPRRMFTKKQQASRKPCGQGKPPS